MANSSLEFLAGIGSRKVNQSTPDISALDVANSAYQGAMKKQFESVVTTFKNVIADIEGVMPDILLEALKPTFELSQTYVPVDTGELKASGYLEKVTFAGGARVMMGYAKGGSPNYALLVHERVDIQHKSPTRAKFLLAAMEEDLGNVYARLLKALTIR